MHRNPGLRQVMDIGITKGTLAAAWPLLAGAGSEMYGYEIAETVHSDSDGAFTWREGSLYSRAYTNRSRMALIASEREAEKESAAKAAALSHQVKHGWPRTPKSGGSWADWRIAVNRIPEKSHG